MSKRSLMLKTLGGITAATGLVTYLDYQRDICAARERVISGSQAIETACGPVEYAAAGATPQVLVVHGAGGGFDQGIRLARDFMGDGFRFIAPSRFGYLRTPLPDDATPAAQADAHACLLDALNIRKVAIVGVSAGALSSMQFALRYPDRTSALVLIVPAAWAPQEPVQEVAPSGFITDVVLRSDFVMWLSMRIARSSILSFLGVPEEIQERLTPEQEKRVSELMQNILPVSRRQGGIINDGINHTCRERYPLENITVPALVISPEDDGTFPGAIYTAENIPGAKFVAPKSGGHLLVGQEEKVRSEVTAFLKQHTANIETGKGE